MVTMKNKKQNGAKRKALIGWVLVAGLIFAHALPVHGEWYFEVGPFYRGDMTIAVRGGSRAAEGGASAAQAGTTGGLPTPGGSLSGDDGTAQILREFDNGHVGPSGWVWANNDGVTQYFGYDDPGQYDAAAGTLTYQLTLGSESASQRSSRTRTTSESLGWRASRRTDGAGLMGTLGHGLRKEESWRVDAQLRFGWLDGIQANFRGHPAFRQHIVRSTFDNTVWREETLTYTYDTLGNPAFPSAPYAMTDPSAVGPLIADTPTTLTTSSSMDGTTTHAVGHVSQAALSRVDLGVDAQAFTLQLGPRILWHPGARLGVLLQPALTVNLLDADVRRTETFRQPNGAVITAWHDTSDKQLWRMGAGVQAGVQLALSAHWHVKATGGYEWVDKYSLSVGPDRIHADLSGYQVELAIGRQF